MVTSNHLETLEMRFYSAIKEGRFRHFRLFLELGVSVNCRDQEGTTPLIMAARAANERQAVNMARCLLRHGACVSSSDASGQTVLHHAAREQKEQLLDLLLEFARPQDVLVADNNGDTSLHIAASIGNVMAAKKLVLVTSLPRLVIDIKNRNGLTPLMSACQRGHVTVARVFVSIGRASPTMRDSLSLRNARDWLETVLFVPDHLEPFKCSQGDLHLITPKPLEYIRPIELREFSINKPTFNATKIDSLVYRRQAKSAQSFLLKLPRALLGKQSPSDSRQPCKMDSAGSTYRQLLPELYNMYTDQQGSYRTPADPSESEQNTSKADTEHSDESPRGSKSGTLFKGAERAIELSIHIRKSLRGEDGGKLKRRSTDEKLGKHLNKLTALGMFTGRKKSIGGDGSSKS